MQVPAVKCRDSEIPPTGELNDPRASVKLLDFEIGFHYNQQNFIYS